MKTTEERAAWEAQRMKVQEVLMRVVRGDLTWIQAADICGYTPRHMRRLKKRAEMWGWESLVWDLRRGRPRRKRIADAVLRKVFDLRRAQYAEFSVRHFHEKLIEVEGIRVSYTHLKRLLQDAGLAPRASARGKYRRLRPRRPMTGMMLHQDGSTHDWLGTGERVDLVVTMDDADGRILHGRLWRQEGTRSSLVGIREVVRRYGLFREFYTDRGSHYIFTRKAGEPPDRSRKTQVARVLEALHVRHIAAYSPQARGRSERLFQTLQGRFPQELKLHGIRTVARANEYLERVFVPAFNQRFAVTPSEAQTAFVPFVGDLDDVVCERYARTVGNDHTVLFQRHRYELPKPKGRPSYARCAVELLRHLDGRVSIAYGVEIIARYDAAGKRIAAPSTSQTAAA